MRTTFAKALGCIAVAVIAALTQFGAASDADARKGVRVKSHKNVHVHVNRNYVNRHRVRRGVATGVAVGVATGVAINSAARYGNTCSNLAYRCNRGEVWACIDHDQRCY